MESQKFIFPNYCCACMKSKQTEIAIGHIETQWGGLTKTTRINIPICLDCQKKYYDKPRASDNKRKTLSVIYGCVLGGLIFGLLSSKDDLGAGIIIGMMLGGFFGYILFYFLLFPLYDEVFKKDKNDLIVPARLIKLDKLGVFFKIEFSNNEYQQQFNELNHLSNL